MSAKIPIENRKCDCGEPAVRKKNGAWVCQRCSDMEERNRAFENRRRKVGEQEEKVPGAPGCRLTKYYDYPEEPICGESLRLLKI